MSTPAVVVLTSAVKSIPTTRVLMGAAEAMFTAPRSGAAKKAWVSAQLVALADKVDIPFIEAAAEHALKFAAADALVEFVWALFFGGKG